MYTFNDWVRMEMVASKAIRAAKEFAAHQDFRDLVALEHAIAEIRHAAGQLGEQANVLGYKPHETKRLVEDDRASINRLWEVLFKRAIR